MSLARLARRLPAAAAFAGLVALRRQRGMSQLEIAELIGVDRVAISRTENGHVSPRLSMLLRYAAAVGAHVGVMPDRYAGFGDRAVAS